jgi:hypothetical protein
MGSQVGERDALRGAEEVVGDGAKDVIGDIAGLGTAGVLLPLGRLAWYDSAVRCPEETRIAHVRKVREGEGGREGTKRWDTLHCKGP